MLCASVFLPPRWKDASYLRDLKVGIRIDEICSVTITGKLQFFAYDLSVSRLLG